MPGSEDIPQSLCGLGSQRLGIVIGSFIDNFFFSATGTVLDFPVRIKSHCLCSPLLHSSTNAVCYHRLTFAGV